MRIPLSCLVFCLAIAAPALANFDAKATLSCVEADTSDPEKQKLVKEKEANEDLVRECLQDEGLPTTPENVMAHALVFDSDTLPAGELRVVRRCDAAVVCVLSQVDEDSVQIASKMTSSTDSNQLSALYDIEIVGSGSMICSLSDSFKPSTDQFKFKASCTGSMELDDRPCTLKLKSGKLFESEGVCM